MSTNDLNRLFGPPPLFESEDTNAYHELLSRIFTVVKPADIFKEFWVRDIIDLTWEVFRLRRLKVNIERIEQIAGPNDSLGCQPVTHRIPARPPF
jgi:hypothetical protein